METVVTPPEPVRANETTIYPDGRQPRSTDVYIVIMGLTGSGKSTFISQLTDSPVPIGNDLNACTSDVAVYPYDYNDSTTVYFIDTPGFDDTYLSDVEILRSIASSLAEFYVRDIALAGVIYLHRITDPRMTGSAVRNIEMLKAICGDDALRSVILTSTLWEHVELDTGVRREGMLILEDRFWGHLVKRGSIIRRHMNTRYSARTIVDELLSQQSNSAPPRGLAIQVELVDLKKPLDETRAGWIMQRDLTEQRHTYVKELESLRREMEQAMSQRDQEATEILKEEQLNTERTIGSLLDRQNEMRIELEHYKAHVMDTKRPNTLTSTNSLASTPETQPGGRETDLLQLEMTHATTHIKDQDHDSAYVSASRTATLVLSTEPEAVSISKHVHKSPPVEPDRLDDEIQSIASDDSDINSQASNETTVEEFTGKALIRLFISEDAEFREVSVKLFPRIGRARFVENIRRLLKSFHKSLLEEARNETERALAKLLRSRAGRMRMSQQIATDVEPDEDEIEDNHPIPLKDKGLVESWLRQLTSKPLQLKLETDIGASDDDWSTSSSEEGSETDMFPLTSDLRSFLSQSKSYRKLLNNLRVISLPPNLQQVFRSIEKAHIWVSDMQDLSLSNRVKNWVEYNTQSKWIWWPFCPPKRRLKHGEARVFWKCSCGMEQWQEVSGDQHLLIKAILADADTEPPKLTYLCGVKGKRLTLSTWFKNLLQQLSPQRATSNSDASQRYLPRTPMASPPSTHQASLRANMSGISAPSLPTHTNISVGQQTAQSIPQFDLQLGSWILFGVQGASRILVPSEIQVKSQSTDFTVFQDLKRCYKSHRGWLRLWFSIWRLDYCQVVRFDRLDIRYMSRDFPDMPTDHEYKYEPRAGRGAQNPPISAHAFNSLFYSCSPSCAWPFPHDCIFIRSGNRYLGSIPKRTRGFKNDLDSPIWGLEAVFEPSVAYVLGYHFLIVVGPLIFWVWWLRLHPDDLQNASVPMTIVLTGLSIFWSSTGILTSRWQKSLQKT